MFYFIITDDHLYWSDATFDTIQQCDLDGANCKTIKNMTSTYRDEQIRDLETDGTYLYYSAYHKEYVTILIKYIKAPMSWGLNPICISKMSIGKNYM
jgi:hypothetical protein